MNADERRFNLLAKSTTENTESTEGRQHGLFCQVDSEDAGGIWNISTWM